MHGWLLAVRLLLCLVISLGQTPPPLIRGPNQQWRIINAEPIVGWWAVAELEFHTLASCNEIVTGSPLASGWVKISTSGQHFPTFAFDAVSTTDLTKAWWSLCGYDLGQPGDPLTYGSGCAIGEAWIGLESAERDFDVKCVRVLQVPNATHSVGTIGLDRWDGSQWVRVRTFPGADAVDADGRFLDFTTEPMSRWRLRPLVGEAQPWPEATSPPWSVAELVMHERVDCADTPLATRVGAAGYYGNGSAASDLANEPGLTLDGDPATAWASLCTQPAACSSDGTWVEAQLSTPVEVRCIRMVQADGFAAAAVLVQVWEGAVFGNASIFLDLVAGVWDLLIRWEVANQPSGSLWRMVPTGTLPPSWRVAELEFYQDANCSLQILPISSFGSGALWDLLPVAAADGDVDSYWQVAGAVKPTTPWEGLYAGGNGTSHRLGFPWLGLHTPINVSVQCVVLMQANDSQHDSENLLMQRWNGTHWVDYRDTFGYGEVTPYFLQIADSNTRRTPMYYQRMPVFDRTQWRAKQTDIIFNNWALKEIRFFETIDCTLQVAGLPIAAGENPLEPIQPARYGFDDSLLTEWWSVCNECMVGQAWIGTALPAPRNVRCLALFQSARSPSGLTTPWFTKGVDLDKWNGHQWVTVASFSGLGPGAWDQQLIYTHAPSSRDAVSSLAYWVTEPDRLWRVTHLESLPFRWAVSSVGFFSDFGCKQRIEDAFIIASGWVRGFETEHAFVQNETLDSEWMSACDGCAPREAWLGLHIPVSRWPRCVSLYQSSRQNFGSRHLVVERFDGNSWVMVTQKEDAVASAWEFLPLPGPGFGFDNTSSYVPLPLVDDGRNRWRVGSLGPTRSSWRVGGLKFFANLSCDGQVNGIPIASGYVEGHGPEMAISTEDLDSYWQASCTNCADGKAWLGISFVPGTRSPRCLQLWQPRDDSWSAEAVSVQVYVEDDYGGAWHEAARFDLLSLGVWDHMHFLGALPLPPTALNDTGPVEGGRFWRIVNGAQIERGWSVRRVRFFLADATAVDGCASDRLIGDAFSAGRVSDSYPPTAAISLASPESEWRSSCVECAVGTVWLGIIFPGPQEVACMDLEQSPDELRSTNSLQLERWGGDSWVTMRSFEGLSSGEVNHLSEAWENPKPFMRFRVIALTSPVSSWRVAELRFFAGVECTLEAKGTAISSGSEGDGAPRLAFDGNPYTFWEAQKMLVGTVYEDTEGSWIGSHFPSPWDIKCALLRQDDAPGRWSPSVALESWTGTAWDRVSVLPEVTQGAWFALHRFQSAWQGLSVNFQDETAVPPPGYVVDSGKQLPAEANEAGFRYGWNCKEIVGYRRGYFADKLMDTGVELDCPNAKWELDVIIGRYYARVFYSNPGHPGDTAGCFLEGVSADAGPLPSLEKVEIRLLVDVVDARLTFSGSKNTSCSSVSAIELISLPLSTQMWRLRAASAVSGRWRVHELQFHQDEACGDPDLIKTQKSRVFSSGYMDNFPPTLASDGNEITAWLAACDGCAGGTSWIGAAFISIQTVRCLRIYQARETESLARTVALESWNGTTWTLSQIFKDNQGGVWGNFNSRWAAPPVGYRWRLKATGYLPSPLVVSEFEFFNDTACTQKLPGFVIASPAARGYEALNAVDRNDLTKWASACGPCNANGNASNESEAWIGLHYDAAVVVLCAAVTLAPPLPPWTTSGAAAARRIQIAGLSLGPSVTGDPITLELELWNATAWISSNSLISVRAGASAETSRLEAVELTPGAAWRLVNVEPTTAPWQLSEVEFHTTSECEGKVDGFPLASSQQAYHEAAKAFDGITKTSSSWVAGCVSSGCEPGQWLGLLLDAPHAFQCIKIYQASPNLVGDPSSAVVRVERWGGTDLGWETVRTFGTVEKVKSGRWVDLIILSATAKFAQKAAEWRLLAENVEFYWSVAELKFFDNIECQGPLVGTPSASAEAANRFVTAAFDERDDTFWWSQGAPGPREAWIGLAFGTGHIIQCVQILAPAAAGYGATSVQLQSRPEADWQHISTFDKLSNGRRQNLLVFEAATRQADSMWRVMNYDPVEEGWALVELEFYSDSKCTRIEVGRQLSPGYTTGQDPAAAKDLRLDSWWRSPCRSCTRSQAWLGIAFHELVAGTKVDPRAVDVNCVVMLQGSGMGKNGSSNVTVERWDGKVFRRYRKFYNVPGGEFVRLRLDAAEGAEGAVVVDSQRKVLLLQAQAAAASDPALQRDRLTTDNARIQATVSMFVASWPAELTSSIAVTTSFLANFVASLREALGAELQQPALQIFVDGATLQSPTLGLARPAIVGAFTVYVAKEGDAALLGKTWETDNKVVLKKTTEISQDPFNVDALLLTDQLKTELRRATRLDPLQASILAQVEAGLELQLGAPVLTVPYTVVAQPPSAAPQENSASEQDQIPIYVGILSGAVSLICSCGMIRFWMILRVRRRLEREAWFEAHPGMPFPRRESASRKVRRCCCLYVMVCCPRSVRGHPEDWDHIDLNDRATGLARSRSGAHALEDKKTKYGKQKSATSASLKSRSSEGSRPLSGPWSANPGGV